MLQSSEHHLLPMTFLCSHLCSACNAARASRSLSPDRLSGPRNDVAVCAGWSTCSRRLRSSVVSRRISYHVLWRA
jgi:hypothetical protein